MASFVARMVGAAKLDPATYEEVEADSGATGQAMAVVLASAVAAGVGSLRQGGSALVLMTLASLVGWFLWAAVIYLVGTRLLPEPETRADLGQLLRTIGFAASPGILRVGALVPGIGTAVTLIASLWMLVATVLGVRQALDYRSTGRAALVCLIGFLVYWVAVMVVGTLLGIGAVMTGGVERGPGDF
jgi:hypothetical protein